MVCPGASDLSAFVDGSADGAVRASIEPHLDECEDCRALVGVLIRSRTTMATSDPALAHTQGAVAAPTGLGPGARIGRYILKEVLGRGGMGVVYAADDPELGREVAIKLVRPELAQSLPSTRRRIVREAQAMAKLSHPNVIAVHDAGTAGDLVFIAMERVRGENLRHWVAKTRRAPARVLEVFLAAGRGLAAAHAAGLIHRDFKPDNVLVGTDGRVRVTDFGLAEPTALGDDAPPLRREAGDSEVGAVVGTPAYMAPEQHAGGHTEPRSDQFSYCVALYEGLYGERPFPGRSRDELAAAVAAGKVSAPPPRSNVPGSLRAILLRGLAVRPGDRFATMDDLLRALGRDRGRLPRQIAQGAAALLLVACVSLFADWIIQERTDAVTRTSFSAARSQLHALLASRTDTFTALSDLSYVVPVLRDAAASVDQADFGLGDPADDRAHLAETHDNLASADFVTFARAAQGAEFGVADYKGRLLFASAEPTRWGDDVRALPAIATAYSVSAEAPQSAVMRGDDPALVASGLLGTQPHPGLQVLFARATPTEGRPRALFVQLLPGKKLLGELALGEGTEMALVAPDGTVEGNVPPSIVDAGLSAGDGVEEVERGGARWLVQRYPLTSPGSGEQIAEIVLARRADVGLAGLFPGAQAVLAVAALFLVGLVVGGLFEARRRDLTRS